MSNVSCPFCGEIIHLATHPSLTSAGGDQCPLLGHSFSWSQWAMRPPKKEQPTKDVSQSEVEWLRCIVEALVDTRAPTYHVSYDNKDLAGEIAGKEPPTDGPGR